MKAKKTSIFVAIFLLFLISLGADEPQALPVAVKIDRVAILKISPEWQENYDLFEVDRSFLSSLSDKLDPEVKIDVYMGTWCSDSKNNVPAFLKIIDQLEKKDLEINFFDVTRKQDKTIKYYVKECGVERLPTFIFYRSGKEIGRIIENPQNSLIEDMLEILF